MAEQESPEDLKKRKRERAAAYWKVNLRLIKILLSIWFLVSIGGGILLAKPLNNFNIGGSPLGFWIAQQGAIYVFVLLIFTYMVVMDRVEKAWDKEDDSK